jgi:hypothetical protein
MIRIAGDDYVSTLPGSSLGKMLHSRNEWAGGVNYFGCAFFQLALHLRCDAMSPDDGDRVGISFFGGINSRYSTRSESFHLLSVVNQWSE